MSLSMVFQSREQPMGQLLLSPAFIWHPARGMDINYNGLVIRNPSDRKYIKGNTSNDNDEYGIWLSGELAIGIRSFSPVAGVLQGAEDVRKQTGEEYSPNISQADHGNIQGPVSTYRKTVLRAMEYPRRRV